MKDGSWDWKDDRLDVPASAALKPLNGSFAVANGRAYFRADPIADSDSATFQALDDSHGKDARHVWYCDTYRKSQEYWLVKRTRATVIAGADPATFRLLTQRYSRDASHIYFEGVGFPVRDPATFEPGPAGRRSGDVCRDRGRLRQGRQARVSASGGVERCESADLHSPKVRRWQDLTTVVSASAGRRSARR